LYKRFTLSPRLRRRLNVDLDTSSATQLPAMTDNKAAAALSLVTLPLEVRHVIFKHAAARDVKPKKLLRYWFEKQEVKQLIAQELADNPNGLAPLVTHQEDYDEDSDVMDQEDGENEDSEDGGDEEDEDNADEDNADHDEDQDEEDEDNSELSEDEDAMEEDGDVQTVLQALSSGQVPPLPSHTQTTAPALAHQDDAGEMDDAEEHDADEHVQDTVDEDGDEAMSDDDNEAAADEDDGDMVVGDDADGTAAAQPPPVPAPVVCAARKWRYIPNFMRITHCPPPIELLLASQQLNADAKNWFYDVAVLRINATGSFAHTSFFEEAFSQITDAAFSPMENIRKVDVTFVWDTTWLRAEDAGCAEAVFPALLRQRSDFVYQILLKAPELNKLTIHWHDSAQDNESANFMLDILAPFHTLKGDVRIEEHYIAADAKPCKKSVAGKRRVEFQAIIDAGLDRLF
jgi:hypothetical protein